MRNVVGMDGDQADGALALERAEPLDDGAGGKPEPAVPRHLDRDEIAVDRARGGVGAMLSSRPSCFLSIGTSRRRRRATPRKMPSTRLLARSMSLMTRPLVSSSFVRSMRISARSPTPATSPGRARRGVTMWMTGGAPCASSSHSVGRASKLAVAVAAGDVGEHDRRQACRHDAGACAAGRSCLRRRVRAACD